MVSSSPGTSSVRVTVTRTVSTCATRWVLLGKTNMLRFGVLGHQSSGAWTSSTKIVRDLLVTHSTRITVVRTMLCCGMLHFDALILGGCKFYCLRKKGCEDITKCKGYKKSKGEELSFADFETMAGGGEKTQKQVQFLCPKRNHLSVDTLFTSPSAFIWRLSPIPGKLRFRGYYSGTGLRPQLSSGPSDQLSIFSVFNSFGGGTPVCLRQRH